MSKLVRLKRVLLRDAVVAGLSLMAAGGVMWFAGQHYAKVEQENNTLRNRVSAANQQVQQQEKDFQKASKFSDQYRSFSGNGYRREDLDRKVLEAALRKLHDQFYLTDIDMESRPAVSLKIAPWAGTKVRLVAVPVTIRLKAFSDEYLLAFLFALDRELPGILRYNKLSAKRVQLVRDIPLKQVGEGYLPSLVEANIDFLWIGFEKIQQEGVPGAAP